MLCPHRAEVFHARVGSQVAAAESAGEAFTEAVVRPALDAPHGMARLRALIDGWIAYAEAPLFPGGCFWAANLPDFDSRPGQVRDTLARQQQSWRDLLAAELGHAGVDADLTAFQLDAVLLATNTALRLGDPAAVPRARRVIDKLLG